MDSSSTRTSKPASFRDATKAAFAVAPILGGSADYGLHWADVSSSSADPPQIIRGVSRLTPPESPSQTPSSYPSLEKKVGEMATTTQRHLFAIQQQVAELAARVEQLSALSSNMFGEQADVEFFAVPNSGFDDLAWADIFNLAADEAREIVPDAGSLALKALNVGGSDAVIFAAARAVASLSPEGEARAAILDAIERSSNVRLSQALSSTLKDYHL